jgi:hypothetical protein
MSLAERSEAPPRRAGKAWRALAELLGVAGFAVATLTYCTDRGQVQRQQAEQVIGVSLDAVEQAEVIYGGNEDGSDKFDEADPPRIQNYGRLPIDEVVLGVLYDGQDRLVYLEVGQLLPCQEALVGPLLVLAAPAGLDLEQNLAPGHQAFTFRDVAGRYWHREGFSQPERMPAGGLGPMGADFENNQIVTRPIEGCVPA